MKCNKSSQCPHRYFFHKGRGRLSYCCGRKRLYVTERATQSIITLSVDGADLKILARTDCKGREPRDFTLLADDRFAVCTNQFDNAIALFRISSEGIPTFFNQVQIDSPLCAVEIDC